MRDSLYQKMKSQTRYPKREGKTYSRTRLKQTLSGGNEDKIERIAPVESKVRGYYTWFGMNNKPLRKYFLKNVGRPLNDLYSELCKNFKKGLERQCLDQYILYHLRTDDVSWEGLYVDSQGIVRKKKDGRKKWRYTNPKPLIDGKFFQINGLWYTFKFSGHSMRDADRLNNIPPRDFLWDIKHDITLAKSYDDLRNELIEAGYYISEIYQWDSQEIDQGRLFNIVGIFGKFPVGKRRLSKKEIKRFNLS